MSQDFKLRFDEMKQGNPTRADETLRPSDNDYFDSTAAVRNLCLVWPDNRMKFYNYAYLVSGDYVPDESSILLTFTTDKVVIKGTMLVTLFEALLAHLPRKLVCAGERYKYSKDAHLPIIETMETMSIN